MTFGDISAADHQQRFEEHALAEFDKLDINITVDPEKRYLAPISVEEAYAFDVTGDGRDSHCSKHGHDGQNDKQFQKRETTRICPGFVTSC